MNDRCRAVEGPSGAVAFQFVQTDHCQNDEYYIQCVGDGRYLFIESKVIVNQNALFQDRVLKFQECQSKATLFRFKNNEPPLDEWRKSLCVGSDIVYRILNQRTFLRLWVKGKVIATKDGEFGKEIQVKYKGLIWSNSRGAGRYRARDEVPEVERVRGEKWIPIVSDLISVQNLPGIQHEILGEELFDAMIEAKWPRETEYKLHGVVKRYDAQNGYGFIACDDGAGDLFVHFSEIKWREIKMLREGERVAFDVVIQPDGRRKAINVMMIGDSGMREYRRFMDRF